MIKILHRNKKKFSIEDINVHALLLFDLTCDQIMMEPWHKIALSAQRSELVVKELFHDIGGYSQFYLLISAINSPKHYTFHKRQIKK